MKDARYLLYMCVEYHSRNVATKSEIPVQLAYVGSDHSDR